MPRNPRTEEQKAARRARAAEINAERRLDRVIARANGIAPQPRKRRSRGPSERVPKPPAPLKPFCGVDGEGAGADAHGRQLYQHLQMGERSLTAPGEHLSFERCAEFILSHPPGETLVAYGFKYDSTQMFRQLPARRVHALFDYRQTYTYRGAYGVQFHPGYMTRFVRVAAHEDANGKFHREKVEGSSRTIWDVFGLFNVKFIDACTAFGIGDKEELRFLARRKKARGRGDVIGPEDQAYCALECRLLAALMEKFRGYCHEAGIRPSQFAGGGGLAAHILGRRKVPTRETVETLLKDHGAVYDMARDLAFFGGRFETARVGKIPGRVWQHDMRGAYPSAMLALPCLEHAKIRKLSPLDLNALPPDELALGEVKFTKWRRRPGETTIGAFGGLPCRLENGTVIWPKQGHTWAWSVEVESARRRGVTAGYVKGWHFERHCDCRPFAWLPDLYAERQRLEALGEGRGEPIKTAMAALYGKFQQRIGEAPYFNPIWGSLITALVRARINDAIALADLGSVVAIAADAVIATRKIRGLTIGTDLGQWEVKPLDDLFIAQNGFMWTADKLTRKTRGYSADKVFESRAPQRFEERFAKFMRDPSPRFPAVPMLLEGFYGLEACVAGERAAATLAQRNAKPLPSLSLADAGKWTLIEYVLSTSPMNKRSGWQRGEGHVVTGMKGGPVTSWPYDPDNELNTKRAALEAMLRQTADAGGMGFTLTD
jgi:DNA polymerase type B, organellar and viral